MITRQQYANLTRRKVTIGEFARVEARLQELLKDYDVEDAARITTTHIRAIRDADKAEVLWLAAADQSVMSVINAITLEPVPLRWQREGDRSLVKRYPDKEVVYQWRRIPGTARGAYYKDRVVSLNR